MGLFIVGHRHESERCPATDPYMSDDAKVLIHVSSRMSCTGFGSE